MRIGLLLAIAALAGAATGIPAPVAGADGPADFDGRYTYVAPGSEKGAPFSTTWTVTPCGDGCVHIVTASGLTDTDAHRDGTNWVFTKYDDAGILCDNEKTMPATIQFSVDPATLEGELQPEGTPCGGASRPSTFSLTKLA